MITEQDLPHDNEHTVRHEQPICGKIHCDWNDDFTFVKGMKGPVGSQYPCTIDVIIDQLRQTPSPLTAEQIHDLRTNCRRALADQQATQEDNL